MNLFSKKTLMHSIMLVLTLSVSTTLIAATDEYSSQLVNETHHHKSKGFRLIKTRTWPDAECLIDTGKQIVNPGQSTPLRIKKAPQCNQGGVGYEIYRAEDTKKEHLLGFLSHRFADEKFSIQISRFCEGNKCMFVDLNPEQDRKTTP